MYNGCGAMSEYRLKNGRFRPDRVSLAHNLKLKGSLPLTIVLVKKLGCYIRMWVKFPFVSSQPTRLTNGQTDRRTDGRIKRPCNTIVACDTHIGAA